MPPKKKTSTQWIADHKAAWIGVLAAVVAAGIGLIKYSGTSAPVNSIAGTNNRQVAVTANQTGKTVKVETTETDKKPKKLTDKEKKALAKCEATIARCQADGAGSFQELALACHQVQHGQLYRENSSSEAAFFKTKFGFSRSHSLRLAQMGKLIDRVSPTGDTVQLLASDAHIRHLLSLEPEQQDAVVTKALAWGKLANLVAYPAKLLAAARTYLNPPKEAVEKPESASAKLAAECHEAVACVNAMLPKGGDKRVKSAITDLMAKLNKKMAVRRSTGIAWTQATWNPLHGCTRASMGCDNCYAAKLTATRLADVYPGLAVKKTVDGKTTYQFTGKIQLVPHDLADPLHDKISKRYFVNSMSDLFHKNVPDAYIEAVFDVMEKASWHTFQVLTKRPERMAEFTQKRYADKDPAANIWLGTSTENQAAYDDRMPHLKATKAAIRWLSVEPMLGPIKFGSMKDIDWVVVGGESGSDRQMNKEWATGIRDACKKDEVPFFFKQWGDFNEQGKKKAKKGGDAKLDGKIHHNYPKV